jgi:hypothetical protein
MTTIPVDDRDTSSGGSSLAGALTSSLSAPIRFPGSPDGMGRSD